MVKTALLVALAVLTGGYLIFWLGEIQRGRKAGTVGRDHAPLPLDFAIGLVTNFFDTLGIGSFATTTSAYKLKNLVPDRLIPGTLNVGHTIPTILQAFLFMSIVEVGRKTLVGMIAAAVAGAWLGAGIVAGWPKRTVQLGMGCALLAAAALLLMKQLHLFPGGGDALAVSGAKLWIAIGVNFALGALMTLGIGLYAPCMILISLLGMNPTAAFPIMMGSCAFLMPFGSSRFIQKQAYSLRAALGLAIGGIPGVLLAVYIFTSLPIGAVLWLVVIVVLYAAMTMLRAASADKRSAAG